MKQRWHVRIVRSALALVWLCVLPALTACRQQPATIVYLLLDVSASTNSPAVRAEYLREADAIAMALSQNGAAIRGDVIGTDALNNSSLPIQVDIPTYSMFNSTPEKHAKAVRQVLATLHRQVETAIQENARAQSTPIMESLQMAQKVLNGSQFAHCEQKQLIVFSDMVQESSAYNFAKNPITASQSRAVLDAEQKAHRIPDLAGVKVWKTGSSAEHLSDERILNLQAFWIAYFRLAGADLQADRYGSSLLNYSVN